MDTMDTMTDWISLEIRARNSMNIICKINPSGLVFYTSTTVFYNEKQK